MKKTLKNLLLTLSLCSNALLAGAQQEVFNQEEARPSFKIICGNSLAQDPVLTEYNTNPEFREKVDYVMQKCLDGYVNRPVTSSLMLGIGGSTVHDTYLTNQLYKGNSFAVAYERNRLRSKMKWDSDQWLDCSVADTRDEASESNSMFSFRLRYHYAMHRVWRFGLRDWMHQPKHLVFVGPYASINIGANYSLSMGSGNNPANMHLSNNFGLSAGYQWNYFIRQRPSNLRFQVQLPVIGAAFSPEYAASYYETFLVSDKGGRTYSTSFHNQQDLDVRLTTDIPVSIIPLPRLQRFGSSLRVGVQYHIETQDINHLITRYSYFQAGVGWTWQYLPFRAPSR